jgi:hypothetical protein
MLMVVLITRILSVLILIKLSFVIYKIAQKVKNEQHHTPQMREEGNTQHSNILNFVAQKFSPTTSRDDRQRSKTHRSKKSLQAAKTRAGAKTISKKLC